MINLGVDPVALRIGSFELRWYGLFLALAVVWLIFWMWLQIRRGAKISNDTMLSMALVGIPSGIIFARVLHVIDNIIVAVFHPELADAGVVINYLQHPEKIVGGEGLTAYGAILGASLGLAIYCKITKTKIGYIFDLLAPGVVIAQAVIGRIGCLLNGCCYGTPTDLPWALCYTDPQSLGFLNGVATHPTVIYEIIFGLIVFAVLMILKGRLKPDGSIYALYLSLYAVWRIGIDFLRDGTPFFFSLHQAQFISIVVLCITIPWMIKHTRWGKKEEQIPSASDITEPTQPDQQSE